MVKKLIKCIYEFTLLSIEPVLWLIVSIRVRKTKFSGKSLAIIKFDAIGDYVLFRNYLQEIKQDAKFKDYKITFIGNEVCREIATQYDGNYIDEFIWIKKKKFQINLIYRINLLRQIKQYNFDIAIQPTYWRELVMGDSLMRFINAKFKVVNTGQPQFKFANYITSNYYNKLTVVDKGIIFEFFRNREFFEQFLARQLNTKFYISGANTHIEEKFSKPYAVIFIGASANIKKWNMEYFNQVGRWINKYFGYKIIVCGTKTDLLPSTTIHSDFENLVGKTSMLELIDVISYAKFVVSNETSIPHIAVALGVKVFVIASGNDFGRFTEYPKSITNTYHAIYPSIIEAKQTDMSYLEKKYYGYGQSLSVDLVKPDVVINRIMNNCKRISVSIDEN